MPGSTLPSSQAATVGGSNGLIARIERIERKATRPDHVESAEMVFSYPGFLSADVESPPWYPRRGGAITLVRVSLLAAATADHVIEVRVNGVAAQQFTLGIGLLTMTEAANINLNPASYVCVKTITVSDSDLSVQMLAS